VVGDDNDDDPLGRVEPHHDDPLHNDPLDDPLDHDVMDDDPLVLS